MNTSVNNFDSIEKIIFEDGISIEKVEIRLEMDLMLIVLNTKAVLRQKISNYKGLAVASKEALMQYELIGGGTGIHWPLLDEDLSFKGFLRDELLNVVRKDPLAA